jgi:hypothetical protein
MSIEQRAAEYRLRHSSRVEESEKPREKDDEILAVRNKNQTTLDCT